MSIRSRLAIIAVVAVLSLMQPSNAAIRIELYTNRAAFVARLDGQTRVVDFDDLDTSQSTFVAFSSDRYRSTKEIVIKGTEGQYVSRTFSWPADYVPVSAPNTYAPGPINGSGNRTDCTFCVADEQGLISGFGVYFIDADYPGMGPSSLSIYDANGTLLGSTGTVSGPNASQLFRGLIAVDVATEKPSAVISSVRIMSGSGWPASASKEGVVLDDFTFSTVVPAACVSPGIPGDFNSDCDVDNDDLGILEACATGPAIAYHPTNLPSGCTLTPDGNGRIAADFDRDQDVDQSDFGLFQRCYSGAGKLADPGCAN